MFPERLACVTPGDLPRLKAMSTKPISTANVQYPQAPVEAGHVEAVPRRIRAKLGDRVVLDTANALYLWEWPFYPQYLVPAEDVEPDALADAGDEESADLGIVVPVSLSFNGAERAEAGNRYTASDIGGLEGKIRFDWDALDSWYEEDEEVFVHPRNPYTRVDALRTSQTIRVELEGVVLAEAPGGVMVFETGLPTRHYLDPTAVDHSALRPSDTVTECPYKGRTSQYWSVEIGGEIHEDLAWSYNFPTRQLLPVTGLVAFYDEKVDVFVDGVKNERPSTHFSD